MGTPPRQSLDLPAAFRFGWEVFKAEPWPLIGAVVASYVALLGAMAILGLGVAGAASLDPVPVPLVVAAAVVGVVVLSVLAQLPTLWMLRAGADAVDGRRVTFRRIVDPAALAPAVAAIGLVLGGVLLGYLLLLLPGIVFGVMAAFTLHFVVDDGRAPRDAVRASIDLFRSQPGPALGLFFLPTFVGGLGVYLCGIGLVVSLPVAMIAQVHGFRQLTGRPVPPARVA